MTKSPELQPICQSLPNFPNLHFHLMPVERGSFLMGGDRYGDEKPVHPVEISGDYYMGQYPVTQTLYKAVMGGQNPSFFRGDQRPVERVSWYDAAVFCNVLNGLCHYAPAYYSNEACTVPYGIKGSGSELPNEGPVFLKPGHIGYRLPTEAEWEYAARGGARSGGYGYAGSDRLEEAGLYDSNSHGETKPTGLKLANELGLYDMSGNVWEWCWDWFDGDYYKSLDKRTAVDPQGPHEGSNRVIRGGSWYGSAGVCRPAYRGHDWPGYRDDDVGFRLALSVSAPVQKK